jgi:hypothetical protein
MNPERPCNNRWGQIAAASGLPAILSSRVDGHFDGYRRLLLALFLAVPVIKRHQRANVSECSSA